MAAPMGLPSFFAVAVRGISVSLSVYIRRDENGRVWLLSLHAPTGGTERDRWRLLFSGCGFWFGVRLLFLGSKNTVAHFYMGLQAAQLFQRAVLGCVLLEDGRNPSKSGRNGMK
ncbi:hypothetical protein TIFTF001_003163 [Ficus carica]|uniref:Uncharacterized protein n=1 Tax=Ficus carica TaxID=3494 RepID=A0AA88CQU8_FICCA|nr:hypothetical protein TIFTF001_003163 [Ficus carica]